MIEGDPVERLLASSPVYPFQSVSPRPTISGWFGNSGIQILRLRRVIESAWTPRRLTEEPHPITIAPLLKGQLRVSHFGLHRCCIGRGEAQVDTAY